MTSAPLQPHGVAARPSQPEMDKPILPAGYYECPKCNSGLEVFVPLSEFPTHCCGVGRKIHTMVYKGEKRAKSRDSIGGLGTPEQDS